MIADAVTVSRILFSLCLLILSPPSRSFAVLYLLCGITDAMDGFLARKLHTESEAGERLDSVADLFFAAAYAVKILPLLCLPVWIRIWTVWIAAVKIFGVLKRSKKEGEFCVAHSVSNKLTGLLLFLLPMTAHLLGIKFSAAILCTVATVAAVRELFVRKGCWGKNNDAYN